MYRYAMEALKEWKGKKNRKPLIIRGARQVGKSYLVRLFGSECFQRVVEINFEKNPERAELFFGNDPAETIRLLEMEFNISIKLENTLLFLDEIQAASGVLSSLRYFYEEMPDIHIIAAGSLLEFVLEEHTFSMPVGRIEYLYIGPFSFEEFLLGMGEIRLVNYIQDYSLESAVAASIHNKLLKYISIFFFTGGMPEAIALFKEEESYRQVDMVKESIISTYYDDFGKYGNRIDQHRLRKLFRKIPTVVGQKFKYANIDREERSKDMKRALHMLCNARIVSPVYHSSCNGLPLGAEINDRLFKVIYLDIGLMCSICGLDPARLKDSDKLMLINSGAVCEQFIGQHLLFSSDCYKGPELYYWAREQRNSSAEVDFVIAEIGRIVPVEVKAGKTGTMKSLHLFMHEKKSDLALRFDTNPPSIFKGSFRLISLPLYQLGQTRRIIRELQLI